MTMSNNLGASSFISSPVMSRNDIKSKELLFKLQPSKKVRFNYKSTSKTPMFKEQESVTILALPRGVIVGWELKSILLVRIQNRAGESLAMTWLESGIAEYGVGKSDPEAIEDLIVSLGEYRESLENKKTVLGKSASIELENLSRLISRLDNEKS